MWNPDVTITINGTNFTASAIADISINYGRQDWTQNIRAAYATFSILHGANGHPYNINDPVVITMAKSVGTATIFTGIVSDFSVKVYSSDLIEYRFTAVSELAKVGLNTVGADGYSAETQGRRITEIIGRAFGAPTWAGTTQAWNAVSWAWNYKMDKVGIIATGFDFGAVASDPMDAMSALIKASQFGYLFENGDGTIDFYDFFSRTGSTGYTDIDGVDTIREGITLTTTSGQVVNEITITLFDGTALTESNTSSQNAYGLRETIFNTYMSSAFWQNVVADNLIADYSIPRPFVDGFVFPLSQLPTATRDYIMEISGNDRITVSGLPAALRNTTNHYQGIVEGWTWRIIKGEAFININLSDYQLSQVFVP